MNSSVPSKPVVFLKGVNSLVHQPDSIIIPQESQDLNYEVELGFVIGEKVKRVEPKNVKNCLSGFFISLDMTERNLQAFFKKNSLPWTLSKSFDTSCPVGDFLSIDKMPKALLEEPFFTTDEKEHLEIWLKVNGVVKQKDSTNLMVHSPVKIVSMISQFMTLEKGDLILTGTPKGIGSVKEGDVIEAGISGLSQIKFNVTKEHNR